MRIATRRTLHLASLTVFASMVHCGTRGGETESSDQLDSALGSELRVPMVWRNDHTGALRVWSVRLAGGAATTATATTPSVTLGKTQRVGAMGDVDGDGNVDIVIENEIASAADASQSVLTVQRLSATGAALDKHDLGLVPVGLPLAGFADMDGDGHADALFRSHRKGDLGAIYMRRVTSTNGGVAFGDNGFVRLADVGIDWRLAGAADFDGDHRADLLFHNRTDGRLAVWTFDAQWHVKSQFALSSVDPARFHVVQPVLTSQGVPALLFRDRTTSQLLAWTFDANRSATGFVGPAVTFDWSSDVGEVDYKYVKREYPRPQLAVPSGERHNARAPATLDLAERSKYALNAMAALLEPADDYNMYFRSVLGVSHPYMVLGDTPQMNAKFVEAIPLMRKMNGDASNSHVDDALLTYFARNTRRDGLFLSATRERAPGQYIKPYDDANLTGAFHILPQARYLSALANYHDLLHHHVLPPTASSELLLEGLKAVSVTLTPAGGAPYSEYYPADRFIDGSNRGRALTALPIPWDDVRADRVSMVTQVGDTTPRTIYGPADHYAHFASELPESAADARAIAEGYASWVYWQHSGMFDADGSFHAWGKDETVYDDAVAKTNPRPAPHFAIRSKTLDGLATLALATNNAALMDYVAASYRTARDHAASDRVIGYYPEYLQTGAHHGQHVETDEVGDMIDLAVKISVLGHNGVDLWDDADFSLRNQFAEMQMTPEKYNLLRVLQQRLASEGFSNKNETPQYASDGLCTLAAPAGDAYTGSTYRCSDDHVLERNLGAFATYATPNAWGYFERTANGTHSHFADLQCCLANGARTLHVVWKHMWQVSPDALKVNLLVNRASKEGDLHSALPYQPHVEFHYNAGQPAKTMYVRIPPWARTSFAAAGQPQISVKVGGAVRGYRWQANYIAFAIYAGDNVSIDFPSMVRSQHTANIGNATYTFHMLGSNVIRVDPAGEGMPFYQEFAPYLVHDSAGYTLDGRVPMADVTRFVAD